MLLPNLLLNFLRGHVAAETPAQEVWDVVKRLITENRNPTPGELDAAGKLNPKGAV